MSAKLSALASRVGQAANIAFTVGKQLLTPVFVVLSYLLYIFPRCLKPAHGKAPHELSSTAYLDAIRGYAAYIVVHQHALLETWRDERGFLWQFSIVRVWFRGHGMVDVFFVISGYALSWRLLNQSYTRDPKAMATLASSTFRRYLRLYGPLASASFIAMLAFSVGISAQLEDPKVLQPTFLGNLQYWIRDTARTANPFAHVGGWWYFGVHSSNYIPQSWTIPVEFRGSIVLFVYLAATHNMKPMFRFVLTWIFIAACIWWQTMYVAEFLMGLWIADIRIYRSILKSEKDQQPESVPLASQMDSEADEALLESGMNRPFRRRWPIQFRASRKTKVIIEKIGLIALFLTGLSLLTGPKAWDTSSSFPFNIVAYTLPPRYDGMARIHVPMGWGAFFLLYAIDNWELLQKPFLLPISQCLGELSFGIYLMHNTVKWAVWGRYMIRWNVQYWGELAAYGFWQLLPPYLVLIVLVLWAAELFRRIDEQILRLNRKLQAICFR